MDDRRKPDPTIQAIAEKLDELIKEFRDHKTLVESGFTRDDLGEVDVTGHRAYHLAVIQRAAKLESRRDSIIDKALSGGAMSAILFTAYSAWDRVLEIIRGAVK